MSAVDVAAAAKARGNTAFSAKDFPLAITEYTAAIQADPTQYALYSNRSGSHASLDEYAEALADAEKCIQLAPTWQKGFNRKAFALYKLDRLDDAKAACEAGLKLGADAGLTELLNSVGEAQATFDYGGPGGASDPMKKLFGDDMFGKLAANPTTAAYLSDPAFVQKMNLLKANPSLHMNSLLGGGDPRMSQAFGVLMNIGANFGAGARVDNAPQDSKGPSPVKSGPVPSAAERARAEQEARLKREADAKAREQAEREAAQRELEEENRREREEELAAMTPEDRQREENKAYALEKKDQGNALYNRKRFGEAIAAYALAVELDPTNATFHTNIAAVLMAQKDLDGCVAACKRGLDVAREHKNADFKFVAKAFLRMGNAHLMKKDYAAAIEAYEASLLEDHTPEAKRQKLKAETDWKEKKRKEYLDTAKAQEAKELGNTLYNDGKFPQAVEAYSDAIKRDPSNHVFYSNRANCYAKLWEFPKALADCEACIKIKPDFAKIYIRKGKILHYQKQYKQAIETFDMGLALDPNSSEMREGRTATLQKIAQENASGVDPERQKRAMQDPEIQQIMRDPTINVVLTRMQEDPASAQDMLRDPEINSKINKLIQAGVIQVR